MSVKRVGILGCDRHIQGCHVALWGDEFEVAGICDPSAENRIAVCELVREGALVRAYDSPEALIEDAGIDVVMIGSLPEYRASHLALALQCRKPVFCEGPLAASLQEMEDALEAIESAEPGLAIAGCYPRRDRQANRGFGWIAANYPRLVAQFGHLESLSISSLYAQVAMRENNRSLLTNAFGHDVDFMRFLLGDCALVARADVDGTDYYKVTGSLDDNGREVIFDCSGSLLPAADSVILSFLNGACAVHPTIGRVRYFDRSSNRRWNEYIRPVDADGCRGVFGAMMHDFAAALGGEQPTNTPQDLLVNTEAAVTLAVIGDYHYA